MNGTSYLVLLYIAVPTTPAADRSLFGIGLATDHRYVAITNAPTFKGTGTGVAPTTGTANPMGIVHPLVLKIVPSQMSYVVYTDQERLAMG